jgi:hypothetical protein
MYGREVNFNGGRGSGNCEGGLGFKKGDDPTCNRFVAMLTIEQQ